MIGLPILDRGQIKKIHEGTLKILSETGIVLKHHKARELLLGNGASTLEDRILIPEELVTTCLSQIPNEIKLQGRDPEKSVILGNGTCYAHNVGGVPNIFSVNKRSHKPASRQDNIEAAQLLDALPNVATITPLYTPQDVPDEEMSLWMVFDTIQNTTKPFRAPGMQNAQEVEALAEMIRIVCPGGLITVGISPISPLNFPDDIVDAIFAVAENGLVLGPLPCPILGATAPMSIAGGLAQQNAEVLASMVLAYLINPGLPVIYKGRLSVMDPRTGLSVWGNPEIGLISAATVEISHYYGIPVDVYGLCTNSHILDIQNGYERAFNALMPVLAGADEISGIGEMEGGISSSLAQIVIDNEILSSIQRLRSGIRVDDDTIGLDIISTVMNENHNFLAEEHTVRHLRSGEVLTLQLAVRNSWSQWTQSGKNNILEIAEMKAHDILTEHYIPPLEHLQIVEIEKVIRNFKKM